jgi:hypothetical protein
VVEPLVYCLERLGVELVKTMAAAAVFDHQTSLAELPKVLRNRWARDWERLGDLAGGLGSPAKQVQYGTASGIGESVEGGLGRICNRTVPHNA